MGNTDKFNLIARQYDTPERIDIAKICTQAIRSTLKNTNNKKAIDFGCGTGLIGIELLNEFDSVLFIDSSENMIDVVDNKISSIQASNAKTLCFDLESNISDLKADYILMAQVLLHIKDVDSLLTKLFNILNNFGHLIIIDFDKNNNILSKDVHNGFEQQLLIDSLTNIRFKSPKSHTFYHGKNIFMGQDASLFILDCEK